MNTLDKIREMIGLTDLRFFNSASTTRTSLGFVKSLFRNGEDSATIERDGLQGIFNYHPISEQIVTSGQPSPGHFPLIRAAGFTTVINLAPHGAENALPNEAELAQQQGMQYLHIPVAFDNPTEADFQRFCQAIEAAKPEKIFVHCAANMRVSAFIYRYRTQILQEDASPAQRDLYKLWKPFGVWAEFITKA